MREERGIERKRRERERERERERKRRERERELFIIYALYSSEFEVPNTECVRSLHFISLSAKLLAYLNFFLFSQKYFLREPHTFLITCTKPLLGFQCAVT